MTEVSNVLSTAPPGAATLKDTNAEVSCATSTAGSTDHTPPVPGPRRFAGQAVATVLLAGVLWVFGLRGADPRAMTDTGLVALFTLPMIAALVILALGFFRALRRSAAEWLLALHVLAFIGFIHATPPALFGTLRYGWAWKHIGIIDYILRTGSVDTTISNLSVYHSWPGFFAGSALLTEMMGRSHLLALATWTQLAFNLFNLLAARFLMRSLTDDRRVIWLALWLFFLTSWLGLDYFSPQGLAFPLYLVLMALVLRACRRGHGEVGTPVDATMTVRRALPLMVLVMGVIATSHQITPLMMVLGLITLFGLRRARGWYVPVVAVVLTVGWAFVVARGYTIDNLSGLTIGEPVKNGVDTLEKSANVRDGQVLVSYAGRFVTAVALGLAGIGIYRSWRRRRLNSAALVLLFCPMMLLAVTEYGGEVLFRVILFTGPFMAYFAALALHSDRTERARTRRAVLGALLTVLLLPGFLLAYFGKDAQNYFTPAEVRTAGWLYQNAEPNSVIVVGSRNFPQQFRNYEKFMLLSIANEPQESRDRVLADPANRLSRWLSAGTSDKPGYILVTRSQKIANDLIGPMPVGSVDRIEQALRASPQYRIVVDTRDAVVFTLAQNGDGK
ncbi:hypothetical protein [Micromonospora sp. NPDC049679]|uniref:hypothetical protein n=1 Tax=Micromonospora sp. NPDC049679 TaxID=3155920 RepID=UPI0033FAD807